MSETASEVGSAAGIPTGSGDVVGLEERLPVVSATVNDDGLAQVVIDGHAHPVSGASVSASRENVVRFIAARVASELGHAIQVDVADPEGQLSLLIHPNGTIEVLPLPQSRRAARRRGEMARNPSDDALPSSGASASLGSSMERPSEAALEAVSAELAALPPVVSGLPTQRQPAEFLPPDAATQEFSAVGGGRNDQTAATAPPRIRPASSLALSALEPLTAPRPVDIAPGVVESPVVVPELTIGQRSDDADSGTTDSSAADSSAADSSNADSDGADSSAAESADAIGADAIGVDASPADTGWAERPIELFTHAQKPEVIHAPGTDFPPTFSPLPEVDTDTFPVASNPTPPPAVPSPADESAPQLIVRRQAAQTPSPTSDWTSQLVTPQPSSPPPVVPIDSEPHPTPFSPVAAAQTAVPARHSGHHAAPVAAAEPSTPELPTLDSLLAGRPAPTGGPAQIGWQATVRRLTGGLIAPKAGPVEVKHQEAVASVQRSLRGPKTVVVVNPKGGAHKTTATLLIAATFGIHRGGYTLAWDNNETRGTLGWRAAQTRHANTAVDLLRDLDRFGDARGARVGDLDNYVRTQGNAQFDVLASDEDAASAASIDGDAFLALHTSLARFYRILVVDTGNNMRASNWQAAVNKADQLVIVSTIREDTAQSAAWLLDGLRAAGQEEAVENAVTVLSAPAKNIDRELSARLHTHFGQLTRTVLDVPHDPALVAGGPVNVERLADSTRESWLHVTAAVAEGL